MGGSGYRLQSGLAIKRHYRPCPDAIIAGKRIYEVAAAAGVSPGTLSDIFADRVVPSPELADRIRQAIWEDSTRRVVIREVDVATQ